MLYGFYAVNSSILQPVVALHKCSSRGCSYHRLPGHWTSWNSIQAITQELSVSSRPVVQLRVWQRTTQSKDFRESRIPATRLVDFISFI